MSGPLTIATTIAVAGALFAATPVVAGTGNGTCDGSGPAATAGGGKQGLGAGNGQRRGPQSQPGQGLVNLPVGTLTEAQKADLAYMVEEEKLARDVYRELATKYPRTVIFKRIVDSEKRHMATVRVLLDRYDVADPTQGKAAGEFASPDLQKEYNDLLASATTRAEALRVGVAIEENDLVELARAGEGVTAEDVTMVYTNLTRASEQHLAAFQSRL